MSVWLVLSYSGNRYLSTVDLAFESKDAALYWIEIHKDIDRYKAERVSVFNLEQVKEIWPDEVKP